MIHSLTLKDFRNYHNQTFVFEDKNIVLYGSNGRGKTNILEALSLVSVGKSWRENQAKDLIRDTASSALIEALTEEQNMYKIFIQERKREVEKNGKKIPLTTHFGAIPSLLFAPEHLQLFSGPKKDRLRFFDRFLFQSSPLLRETLTRFNQALKQKNALLKSYNDGDSREILTVQMFPWEEILAETIPQILEIRQDFLTQLNPLIEKEMQQLSQNSEPMHITLDIKESYIPTTQGVRDFFGKNRSREFGARKCIIGAHLDDFSFFLREKPLTSTASRGEERSVLLSLLNAQKQLLQKNNTTRLILLLDDVFSELDQSRQDSLEKLCSQSQIFFTTTHDTHFKNFKHPLQKISIKG